MSGTFIQGLVWAARESKYCSDYCESIGKEPSIACNRGHAECAAGEAAGAPIQSVESLIVVSSRQE